MIRRHHRTPPRTVLLGRATGIVLALLLSATTLAAQPANDLCGSATAIGFGSFGGDTFEANSDGESSCEAFPGSPDRWYSLTFQDAQKVFVDTPGGTPGMVLSVHDSCPGTLANEQVCSASIPTLLEPAAFALDAEAGRTYWLRVATVDEVGIPLRGGYDFRVGRGGVISGRVANTLDQSLEGISVVLNRQLSGSMSTRTDSEGRYRFEGLAGDDYSVSAGGNSPYIATIWENQPCPYFRFCLEPTFIPVTIDSEVADIDFQLELGAAITGQVRDAETGADLAGITITLWDSTGSLEPLVNTTSDQDGVFRFQGLAADTYTVAADRREGFRPQLWGGIPCGNGTQSCDPRAGTPIRVGLGETATGIDFDLDRGTSIRGRVTDALDGSPITSAAVQLLTLDGGSELLTITDSEGRYELSALNPGTYLVGTDANGYVNELWSDVPCFLGGACPFDQANALTVDLDQPAMGIDFPLDRGGEISGQVFNASTLEGIDSSQISVYDRSGNFLTNGFSEFNGNYRITNLPAGIYRLAVEDRRGRYAPQVFDGVACPDASFESCDLLAGNGVPLAAAQIVERVDFGLRLLPSDCTPSFNTLCLNGGRFRVEVESEAPGGPRQFAAALPIDGIDDSGLFWFFAPDNIELVVKVLDACFGPRPRYWVYAAGLTDVLVQMTVTDTATGAQEVYFNNQGKPFQPVLDTGAFRTCDVASRPLSAATGSLGTASPREGFSPSRAASRRDLPLEPLSHGTSPCEPGSDRLCLGDDERFRVEATWRTADGATGTATAIPQTRDSGLFWFFEADNVELVVKVLDACFGPRPRYWVYAAGLTDVEVELIVTDTHTEVVRRYGNALGDPFQPILDTAAFATCE